MGTPASSLYLSKDEEGFEAFQLSCPVLVVNAACLVIRMPLLSVRGL